MKINQKFAKKAMIAASLTVGIIGFNSMFNEAQASGSTTESKRYQAVGEDGVNYCYCNKAGTKCGCIL